MKVLRKRYFLPLSVMGFLNFFSMFSTQVFAVEPSLGAVSIEQDLLLPLIPPDTGDSYPLCVDGFNGLLVAGCNGIPGPEGPQGPDGDPGLPGNLALAEQTCPAGELVTGFDGDGNIVCAWP